MTVLGASSSKQAPTHQVQSTAAQTRPAHALHAHAPHVHAHSHAHSHAHAHAAARIGPNAIIQTAAALVSHVGAREASSILEACTPWRLDHLPDGMVEEQYVTALVHRVMERYPGQTGAAILREAGVRTADYLLRVRIPRAAQRLLALLPRSLGLRLLLSAIERYAWTFAGSARFTVRRDAEGVTRFDLQGCPVCRGMSASVTSCDYYAGTVEQLVRVILAPRAEVCEEQCEAMGDPRCSFRITLAATR